MYKYELLMAIIFAESLYGTLRLHIQKRLTKISAPDYKLQKGIPQK